MATRKKKSNQDQAQIVIDYVLSCRDEGEDAKRTRMDLNKSNYNMYHMRHNFDHKEEGQSTEVLSKQPMAVEQISSFFQQAFTLDSAKKKLFSNRSEMHFKIMTLIDRVKSKILKNKE